MILLGSRFRTWGSGLPKDRKNPVLRIRLGLNPTVPQCSFAGVITGGDKAPDLLLLDGTNILSKAKADSRRWKGHHDGAEVKTCFRAWVDFLQASTANVPIIAVFDSLVSFRPDYDANLDR